MCWKAEHFVSATIKYSLVTYTTLPFKDEGGWGEGAKKLGGARVLWSADIRFTVITASFTQNPLWVPHGAERPCLTVTFLEKSLFWLFQIIFRLPSCLFSGKHLKVSVQMRSHLQTPKFHVIAKFQGEWQIYYRASISQEFGLKSFRLKMWKSFYMNVFTNMNSFHVYNKNCSFFKLNLYSTNSFHVSIHFYWSKSLQGLPCTNILL